MDIQIQRSKSDDSLHYNFSKCSMSVEDLKKSDLKKYQELQSANKLPNHNLAKILDHNLPAMFNTLERSTAYMRKIAERADNDVKLVISHLKLSLHPDDYVDDNQFTKIGRETLDELGYDDNPYMIFRHYDEPHSHIHIVASTIKKNGKHTSSSWEGIQSNKIAEKLEEKYGLITKRSKIREFEGLRGRSWNEQKVAYKTGYDTLKNIIRGTVKSCYNENMKSLNLFTRALSRSGIGFHISKFKTKDMLTKYGVYYTLDPKKCKFQFSSEVNTMPSEFRGNKLPSDSFERYQNGTLEGIIINKEDGKEEFNFSQNFFNEVHISDSPLIHPPMSQLKKISMKGNEAGSKWSFYGLQNQIGFTEDDGIDYRKNGNDNSLDESPEQIKLLYSMQRQNKHCIVEAFEEGASSAKIDDLEKNYFMNHRTESWHQMLKMERETKEKMLQNSYSPKKENDKVNKKENEPNQQRKSGWNVFKSK